MATVQRTTAVGVFADRQHAQQAVNELRRLGFREDQIGVAARNGEHVDGATATTDKGSNVGTGAATGLAAGAGLGALWGIGIVAGLLPAIGPAIAGGALAAILSSAAAGAVVAGLAGALIGMGIPEEEAKYYEGEFHSGRTIVTVKADGRYDEAVAVLRRNQGYDYSQRQSTTTTRSASSQTMAGHAAQTQVASSHATATPSAPMATMASTGGGEQRIQAREEELQVRKQPVQTGEVQVRKEVHTEHRTVEVPVNKEEVVIERRPVTGHQTAATAPAAGEQIRIPVTEEQVHIEKQPVVKEEVVVGKRKVQDTEKVSGTVRKEEIKVEKQGNANVRDKR